jgi:hypothetical protein
MASWALSVVARRPVMERASTVVVGGPVPERTP